MLDFGSKICYSYENTLSWKTGDDMPFRIIKNDITKVHADAVVNAANSSLLGGSGVDGAIHRAAGPELLFECRLLGGCKTGQAKITKGYDMPCKHIIHTVGPVWQGGTHNEPELLYSCYKNSLELAEKYDCRSVAFPLISAGIYGYPKDKALSVAVSAITDHLENSDIDVTLVVLDRDAVVPDAALMNDLREYITENYSPPLSMNAAPDRRKRLGDIFGKARGKENAAKEKQVFSAMSESSVSCLDTVCFDTVCLEEADALSFDELDESFSEALLRMIDERGLTDPQVYKKANIDRRLFSKIRSDKNYRPSKVTAVALAIALELDMPQTASLLDKAGFTLSNSIKFDVIIRYFIERRQFDINTINETLFAFDQSLIGC